MTEAIKLLEGLLDSLSQSHPERRGLMRAIELLRSELTTEEREALSDAERIRRDRG